MAIARRWFDAADDALAVEAISLVAEDDRLPSAWCDRLRRVRGVSRPIALAMLLRADQKDVAAEAAAVALDGGPHAFELFDAIDEAGSLDSAVFDVFRPAMHIRWGLRVEHVRAVASLASVGVEGASGALWRFARRRRRDLQGLALAELLRVGSLSDVERVVELVRGHRTRCADYVVANAWRSPHRVVRDMVCDVLASHADVDVRLAAVDSCGRFGHADTIAALGLAARNDPRADIRDAATSRLTAMGPPASSPRPE
jgi:hypothetical protein